MNRENRITRVVIYARVSGKEQETANQVRILEDLCNNPITSYTLIWKYIDQMTGSTADRPEFKRMFADAAQGKFDAILFWSLDRFSREGALETLKHLERLNHMGIGWRSFTEQYLDSAGIFKDAIISIMATLAKQERLRISERTKAGIDRAKAQAFKEGREWITGRRHMILPRERIRERYHQGLSLRQVAKEFKISHATVARIVKGKNQPKVTV